jgi:G3E family GTPase
MPSSSLPTPSQPISSSPIRNVPTNIITGFLGAGKTTAILHLLKSKPEHERWAVLVNEFGEIGIDASLIEGQSEQLSKHDSKQANGLFITQVPGGCMCCASGVPMQIALNALLTKAKPDRLLIEPTGLGHPKEVLKVLRAEHYQDVLQLNATITLVDARHISDERYTNHDTFNQQLDIADVIVANKADLCDEQAQQNLTTYLDNTYAGKPLHFVTNGALDPSWLLLDGANTKTENHDVHHHHHAASETTQTSEPPLPACGYLKAHSTNGAQSERFQSVGWRFNSTFEFDQEKITALLSNMKAQRVKAVINTSQGAVGFNISGDGLTTIVLAKQNESRIDIICDQIETNWTDDLLTCVFSLI